VSDKLRKHWSDRPLLELLRSEGEHYADAELMQEAADRIEALEQALDRAHEWLLDDCHGYRASTLHRDIKALLTPSAAPEPQ
jgi:chromosome condensin MukBEF ATPase and DNA-binding subunit MukB